MEGVLLSAAPEDAQHRFFVEKGLREVVRQLLVECASRRDNLFGLGLQHKTLAGDGVEEAGCHPRCGVRRWIGHNVNLVAAPQQCPRQYRAGQPLPDDEGGLVVCLRAVPNV